LNTTEEEDILEPIQTWLEGESVEKALLRLFIVLHLQLLERHAVSELLVDPNASSE
jgi:hypothetical protein